MSKKVGKKGDAKVVIKKRVKEISKKDVDLEDLAKEDELEEIDEDVEEDSSNTEVNERLSRMEVDDSQFRRFVQQPNWTPQVLENIASEGQDVEWSRDPNAREESSMNLLGGGDSSRYGVGEDKGEQMKYTDYSRTSDISRININEVGRDSWKPVTRDAGFIHSENLNNESSTQEKYFEAPRVDVANVGRENPFKKNDVREVERKKSDYIVK